MSDQPETENHQETGTEQASQGPPPPLPQAKGKEIQGKDPKPGAQESGAGPAPETSWARFKKWVYPMEFTDAVMILLTIFIAMGTIASAVAIGYQWHEMHVGGKDTTRIADAADVSANAAGDSADAAQQFADTADDINRNLNDAVKKLDAQAQAAADSIKATQGAMRLDQRAWVVVKGFEGLPELGKPWTVRVVFTDSGRTPARNVRVSCNVEGEPPSTPFRFNELARGAPFLISPNEGDAWCVLYPTKQVIRQDMLDDIAAQKMIVAVFGSVTYDDIFAQSHWYTFCRWMAPDHAIWEDCASGGDATGDGKPPKHAPYDPN